MSKPKQQTKTPEVGDFAGFDKSAPVRSYTFWPRSEPARRVTTQGEKWYEARELAAKILGVPSQDLEDRA